jgi:hypothetical protein
MAWQICVSLHCGKRRAKRAAGSAFHKKLQNVWDGWNFIPARPFYWRGSNLRMRTMEARQLRLPGFTISGSRARRSML